jgi:glycosyltransferase involved in cell wall biosynthesis
MKILQVGSGLHGWAGIERYVVYLSDGLRDRGHEVSVSVTPGTPFAEAVGDRAIAISVRNKFDLQALGAYTRLFRAQRFDIVHTHFNPDFLVVAYAAKLAKGPKLVMTRHVALPWAALKAKNFAMLYDRIIPVSEASQRKLLASGVPAGRMRVAKAGCPALIASAEVNLGAGFNAGFFGRLAPEKGLRVLLGAAEILTNQSGMTLHIFGDGPLRSEVEAAASNGSNIRCHGFRTDIADCMSAVNAVVIPSVWEEAFPYSALEAMSVGRPIVASDIGGLPELVEPHSNGLLFAPGDAAGLAAALTTLASNPGLGIRLGGKGREIQRQEYTVPRMAERIEAVYRELI